MTNPETRRLIPVDKLEKCDWDLFWYHPLRLSNLSSLGNGVEKTAVR